jgi:putative tryptophan/tyrosine transport system substrate-binding protein
LSSVAGSTGIQLVAVDIRSPGQIDAAFKTLPQLRANALMVLNDGAMVSNAAHLVQLIAAQRVPAIYGLPQYTAAGGLMFYGSSAVGSWIQVATYVDRIFKGANPADLPVENPTTFELTVNLKTARSLGITVPQSILLRADQVVK